MDSLFGLSITAESVEAVELVRRGSALELTAIGEWKRPPATDLAQVGDRLASFVKANAIGARQVSVGLDTSLFIIHTFPVDAGLTQPDWQRHARWELSQLIPSLPEDEHITDVFGLAPHTMSSTQNILSISIRRNDVRSLRDGIRAAGLELHGVDGAHFCAETMFVERSLPPPDGRVLFVGVKKQRIEWSLLDHAKLLQYGSRWAEGPEAIEAELRSPLNSQHQITRIVLHGPLVTQHIQEHLQKATALPVQILDPFETLLVPQELPLAQHFGATSFRFAAAVGAALRNAGEP